MPDSHFTLEAEQEIIAQTKANWSAKTGYGFGIFLDTGATAESRAELIGRVNLANVVWGAWRSCTIGYWLDQQQNGRGLATEAVRLAVKFALTDAGLHRVQGAVMPRNRASRRVLEKVGFHHEGLARFYLQINGVWEDHDVYSITLEDWDPA